MELRRKNLRKYILPTVAGSATTFLYIVVDGIFVGRGVGVNALGAVNIALPFTMLTTALATLMSIGGITVTAIRLGREDKEGANNAFLHSTLISLSVAVLMSIIGMVLSKQIAVICGANDTFVGMSSEYIFYYSAFAICLSFSILMQGFIRNDGSPVLVGVAVVLAALTNVVLDWLFIFPLQMGVKGAAIASGLGQILGIVVMMTHFIRKKGVLHFEKIVFSLHLAKKIAKRGLPEMISQFGTPITTLCMNYVLINLLGDIYVSAFSVISYLLAFSMGIFFGVSEGLQPLIGQSYGRKDENDVKYYFKTGLMINFISACIIYGLFSIFGKDICAVFNDDPVLIKTAAEALPKFGLAFLFISLNLMINSYFYSTKRTVQAVLLAICRCIIFNSAIVIFFPVFFGKEIIWFSAGIAELISFGFAFLLLKRSERNGILFH